MTAVVMLPGLDGTGRLLDDIGSRLAQLGIPARTIAYPPELPLNYVELEAFVRARLPSNGNVVLLGESFSGPLAIRIAADPPAGLVGLVLSTTFARAPVPALVPLSPLLSLAPARPPMPLLAWMLLGSWATPTIRSMLADALRTVSPSVLRARAIAALRADVSALLPSVRVPVLQLVASHDRLLARAASRTLAAGLPFCRSVTVAGPHLLLQASMDRCAQEVATFVSSPRPSDAFESTPSRSASS